MILPEYENPKDDSIILRDDEFNGSRYHLGQKVVTIKDFAPVVLTITSMERITSPGYPSILLEGVDCHNHLWHAYSDNCVPYEGDVIYLSAQNNTGEDIK